MSAGTLTLTNKSAAVSGTGTSFTTELKAGDFIVVKIGGTPYTLPVKTITNNTQLTFEMGGPDPQRQSGTRREGKKCRFVDIEIQRRRTKADKSIHPRY